MGKKIGKKSFFLLFFFILMSSIFVSAEDYYGEMWNYSSNATSWNFDIDTADVYYNLTGCANGSLNGFTHASVAQANGGSYLTAEIEGLYNIEGHFSFEASQANALYGIGVARNFDISLSRNCYSRRWATINQAGSVSLSCIIYLEVGDTINLQIENEENNRDIKVHTVNINAVSIDDGSYDETFWFYVAIYLIAVVLIIIAKKTEDRWFAMLAGIILICFGIYLAQVGLPYFDNLAIERALWLITLGVGFYFMIDNAIKLVEEGWG